MSNFRNKVWWYLPDYFDRWRVFPRLFISIYIYLLWTLVMWFMGLPDPSISQAGMVSAIVGVGAAWFQIYVGGAPKMSSNDLNTKIEADQQVFDRINRKQKSNTQDASHQPPDDFDTQ